MLTAKEIPALSKKYKSKLLKYFFESRDFLEEPFGNFKRHESNAMLFLSTEKAPELCRLLKTPFFQLEELLNKPDYKCFTIKKKKDGTRQICAPVKQLKAIQKRLNYYLQAYYLWIKPDEVHGFVINPYYRRSYCNIVENAKAHVNKKHVLNIDLKDFFHNISARQVKELFSSASFNFNDQIASALTLLTTYAGKLPVGAPSSPVISNFICLQLDSDLTIFCRQNNLTYSRYADDLTFSADTDISTDIVLDIINLIKKNHFKINAKKVRLKSYNHKQTVTGLTVNKKVNVDRRLLKKIRAMLHDLTTNGIEKAVQRHFKIEDIEPGHREKFIYRLVGYINFIGQVRGKKDPLYLKKKSAYEKWVSEWCAAAR
jgi:RNA-directed DNA polymerase